MKKVPEKTQIHCYVHYSLFLILRQKQLSAHINKGGHYVYFKTKNSSTSFLTNKNFQTQLGRQIVFQLELETNQKTKNQYNKIIKENKYANIWKWQEFPYNRNILKTIKDLYPSLLKIKNNYNFESFKKT